MIIKGLRGDPLPVYGDGSNVRDWLFVEDHARALWTVCSEGVPGRSYNVGGHNEKFNLEVVPPICDLIDKHAQIGQAHDCNPVTNAQHVCRLLLQKKPKYDIYSYTYTTTL